MREQAIGFSTSALVHGVFGLLLFTFASAVPEVPAPTVIDLSILAGPASPPAPAAVPVQEPAAIAPPTPPPPAVVKEVVQQKVVPPRKRPKIVKKVVKPIPEAVKVPAPAPREAIEEEIPSAITEGAEVKEAPSVPMSKAPQAIAHAEGGATSVADKGGAAGSAGSGLGKTLTAEERWRQEHFNFIKDEIRKNMTYPRVARQNGWQGRVLVSFVICQDGRVEDIRLEKSSGFALLDRNALSIIKQIAPFPKPPVRATLIVPIEYTLG